MGWIFVLGRCWLCHGLFTFNLDRVPSLVIDGQREPLCRPCVAKVNASRSKNGLDPLVLVPGAYEPEEV